MRKLTILLALFIIAVGLSAQTRTTNKSAAFTAGHIPIFIDSLKGEAPGEFPAHWDLTSSGVVEIMEMDEAPVIGFVRSATITPLLEEEQYLPTHFTIEFDAYFHNKGNEAYYLIFDNRSMDTRFSLAGINHGGGLNRTSKTPTVGWKHISLSFNERAQKAFLDGERLVNVPNITTPPTRFSIKALSHNGRSDKYAVIRNIRLMEGGMPLYERIITDGGFVTNRIQFASGSAKLKEEAWPTIREVATVLREHQELKLTIEGHTDGDGKRSTLRTTAQGKYRNRRVVFTIRKEE